MVDLGYAALVQRSDLQEGEVWRVSRCIKCAGVRQAVVDLTPCGHLETLSVPCSTGRSWFFESSHQPNSTSCTFHCRRSGTGRRCTAWQKESLRT